MSKPVILTGLRANGDFHLGNYLGGIQPMLDLQEKAGQDYQLNMFIPDLHSFTTPIDHGKLYQNTLDNLKVFVAAGLDIDRPDTYIYRQSYIPAHSEMAWILDCFTSFGEASRMIEFKEKAEQQDQASVGLLNYPVLMAADILLYGASWVPVGADQQQHIELTRNLAVRLNNKFGNILTVPEEWQKQLEFANRENARIRSLRNPAKKMSKSIEDPSGTIMLNDNPDEAVKKIMAAETDSVGAIHLDWDKQPGISNLLQILALLTRQPVKTIAAEWDGKSSYGDLKSQVAEQVKRLLIKLQADLKEVDESKVLAKVTHDEETMNKVANATLLKVQQAVGLRPAA